MLKNEMNMNRNYQKKLSVLSLFTILFFCGGANAQTVAEMQWWFDSDVQNIGSSTNFSHDIPTSAIPEGIHTLNIRLKDREGNFSPVSSSYFMKLNHFATSGHQAVEFWFDNDVAHIQTIPLLANGSLQAMISTATIGAGLHTLNYRATVSPDGYKGAIHSHLFLKLNNAAVETTRLLEYWFDDDFASRLQTPVVEANSLLSLDLNTDALSLGGHLISFRYGYENGIFSDIAKAMFVKGVNPYAETDNETLTLTEYTYSFDSDTTFIVPYTDSLATRHFVADLDASYLSPGKQHELSIRFKRSDGQQSIPVKGIFHLRDSLNVNNDADTLVYHAAICYGESYTVNGFNIVDATTSGTYFTNVNIGGIDKIRQLNLTVYPPIGHMVTGISPAHQSTASTIPLAFSWNGVANASCYDFYLWETNSICPDKPTKADYGAPRFEQTEALEYGKSYQWKIVAKNNCEQYESPVFDFTLRQTPNLHVTNLTTAEVDSITRNVTISYTIANDGLGTTIEPYWFNKIWLIPNIAHPSGTLQPNVCLLAKDTVVQALASGESYTHEFEVTLPGRWYGNYWLVAATDMNNVSAIDWSGNSSPYLFAHAGGDKKVFEENETNAHCDNFSYRELIVPKPPRKPFIFVSKDTIDFAGRTILLPDSIQINISLQDLLSPVNYTLTGDTQAFSVTPSANYTDTTGGWLNVKFSPTAIKDYAAMLTFSSDTTVSAIVLKGSAVFPTSYNVSAEVPQEKYSTADSVLISGKAIYNNHTTAANVPVRVVVSVMGYNRNFVDTTDINGNYSVLFKPQENEAGHYAIRAFNPSVVDNAVKEEFDIPGFKLNAPYIRLEVENGIAQTGTILFDNRSNIALHDIRFEIVQGLPNAQISLENINLLPASGSTLATFNVLGTSITESNNWEEIKLKAESVEGMVYYFSIWFYCKPTRGLIQATPNAINALMTKGKSKLVEFEIRNNGNGETGDIVVTLPEVDWMIPASSTTLVSLAPNDSAKVSFWLSPTENTPLNTPMSGSIAVNCTNGSGTTLPFTVEAISDSTGRLVVDVVDEYFYNTSAAPHLANARVVVAHPYSFTIIAEGFTNSEGLFTIDSIPEGNYTLFVEAEKRQNYRNNIIIDAGATLNKQVFVSFNAVSYSWTVTPTEIEDHYEITLNTTYETNVPVPVIQIIMPSQIPLLEGEQEYHFDFKVKNLGLIDAHDVTPQFPNDPVYLFIPLVNKIDTLAAQSTQIIPVTVVRKDLAAESPVFAPYFVQQKLAQQNKRALRNTANEEKGNCTDVAGTYYQYYCGEESNWKYVYRTVKYEGRKCEAEASKTIETVQEIIDEIFDEWSNNSDTSNENNGSSGGGSWGGIPLPSWITPAYPSHPVIIQTITDCATCDKRKCLDNIGNAVIGEAATKFIDQWYDFGNYYYQQIMASGVNSTDGYFNEYGQVEWNHVKNMYNDIKELRKIGVDIPQLPDEWYQENIGKYVDEFNTAIDWYKNSTTTMSSPAMRLAVENSGDEIIDEIKDKIEDEVNANIKLIAKTIEKNAYQIFPLLKVLNNIANVALECTPCLIDWMWNGAPQQKNAMLRHANNNVSSEYQLNTEKIQVIENYFLAKNSMELELIGDIRMIVHPNLPEFLDAIQKYVDLQLPIPDSDFNILVSGMPDSLSVPFTNRWNSTLEAWNNGIYNPVEYDYPNIISAEILGYYAHHLDSLEIYAQAQGFESVLDMTDDVLSWFEEFVEDEDVSPRQGVCASVSMQLSQKVTMTREAFRGALTLHNGHESLPMENIALDLEIKDAQGSNCNHLFHIETESLIGELTAVDGTGALTATSDGTANILFIPTIHAAPGEAKTYSFGGKLSYSDPFTSNTVTVDLFPVPLEVHPGPNLHLYYFMQRDILADDPLTENIEPSIAANLGVMVQNKGYGAAKIFSIESAQPQIVDNKKGVAIHFEIIGAALNGMERPLGLTGIHFGNLDAQSVQTGQWWLTTNLLGHFTSYEARMRHLDSRGNPDLSLIDSVEIHELTRFITAYGDLDDNIHDFLVNDVADAHDYPDAIYFSNATRTRVQLADTAYVDGLVQPGDLEINLAVQPKSIGWNYALLDDPAAGIYQLIGVVREDGQEIPLDNIWQTACTLPDNREPIYENNLHFVDTFSTAGLVNYTLYFEKTTTKPERIENITEIAGIKLYPNPTKNTVLLEVSSDLLLGSGTKYAIVNLLGEVLAKDIITAKTKQINVSALPTSVYFVKIYIGNQIITKKILKE
jgi:hypothetical protein